VIKPERESELMRLADSLLVYRDIGERTRIRAIGAGRRESNPQPKSLNSTQGKSS
jgi:hypothetical protein